MSIKHRIEYSVFIIITNFVKLLGVNRIDIVSGVVATFVFYFLPIRKKIVLKNLSIAFPEKTSDEIKTIAFRNYKSFAKTFLEIPLIPGLSRQFILDNMDVSRLVQLKESLKPGTNGLILLTAHFGNWELGAVAMGLWLNTSISVLAKEQKNVLVSKKMKFIREIYGNKEVLLGASVRELYKTLKNGGTIGVVADQRAPKNSMRVNFFGRSTAAFPGAASLALKLKPPLFVILFRRLENGKYVAEAEEIDYANLPEKEDSALVELTQRYFNILEKYIRMSPEQWFWMHNIWKH